MHCRVWRSRAGAASVAVAMTLVGCSAGPADPTDQPTPTASSTVDAPANSPSPAPPVAAYAAPPATATWQLVLDGSVPDDPDAAIVDVDAEVGADAVAGFHANGQYAICYVSIGSWEDWRPDADQFPESVLGEPLDDWPGERYVDLRALDVLGPLWEARLDACAAAGFDAVDPDNVDSYENSPGFPLTEEDAAAALLWFAEAAHERGLAVGLKNAPELVPAVADAVDFAVVEQCLQYDFCGDYAPLVAAGKAVLAVEYRDEGATLAQACPAEQEYGLSMLLATYDLDALGKRCD